jgi:Fe-S-cluster containining protein
MFPCSGCGLCCQNIGHIEELKEFNRGDGVCKYYDFASKLCLIYETRPDICQIDTMYQKEYFQKFTKEEFYKLNAEVCNKLQELYNMDISYRVSIKGE